MIELKNIRKSFKDKEVLINLSYSFPDSGLFIINGDNMSGKTTLLYILAFFDSDYQGKYLFNGINVKSLNGKEKKETIKKTILVFSHGNLLPHLSVEHNAYLGTVCPYQLEGIKDTNRNPDTLSGGEEILLILQREEHSSHSAIFFDEITSPLSDKNFSKVMNELKKMSQNKLIVLNSHDERTKVFDKQLFLEEGKLHD